MIKKKILCVLGKSERGWSLLKGTAGKSSDGIMSCQGRSNFNMEDPVNGKDIVRELKNHNGNFCLVLPRHLFILKSFMLPTHRESEMRDMIALQLPAHIPYPEENVAWDFSVLERFSQGHARVLVMIISLDTVKPFLNMLSLKNLDPGFITLSSWGLTGCVRLLDDQKITTKVYLVIHIEDSLTEMCFCDREKFYFSRQIPWGHGDLEKKSTRELLQQISLTVEAYRKDKMGPEPTAGIVFSVNQRAGDLAQELKKELGFDVNVYDLAGKISNGKNRHAPDLPASTDSTFAVEMGLLGMEESHLNNFLPKPLLERRNKGYKIRRWFKSLAIFTAAYVSVLMTAVVPVAQKTRQLTELKSQISEIHPGVLDVQEHKRKWESLQTYLRERIPLVDLIDELYRLTPDGAAYNSFHLRSNRELTLKGQALSGGAVNQLQSNLLNSPWFKNATLNNAAKRQTVRGEVTQFLITVNVEKPYPVDLKDTRP